MNRTVELVIVAGAVGALAYYVWRRAQPSSVPVAELERRASLQAAGNALAGAAWVHSDPLGLLYRDPGHLAELEEDAFYDHT